MSTVSSATGAMALAGMNAWTSAAAAGRRGQPAAGTPVSGLRALLLAAMQLAATVPRGGLALQNGFRLPQLGWNSWNHYGCGVTEQDIKDPAWDPESGGSRQTAPRPPGKYVPVPLPTTQ